MPSFNKTILMGNLTRSPELRYATQSGNPIATLGLAVNRKWRQGEELKEEVGFFDVVVFGKAAESAAQYLDKGDCIQVDGRLQQRRWETEHGEKRSKIEVVADHVTFIKTKRSQQPGTQEPSDGPDHAPYE